ncbi:unnamed protein product [Notodromas monacha]|uniref:Transcriptional adapter 3 n=1 Tax=Notodromas monacha TaxID=399045 RepID=A0A7R9BMX5_9CRUS|nr:unnamed protein product [Notodromas monacha]CAG0918450.1 unnamed protein product [Notodromas monacha]
MISDLLCLHCRVSMKKKKDVVKHQAKDASVSVSNNVPVASPSAMEIDDPASPEGNLQWFPDLPRVDAETHLKTLNGLLSRDEKNPVVMEELDALQADLESALCQVVMRQAIVECELKALKDGAPACNTPKFKKYSDQSTSTMKRHPMYDEMKPPKKIKEENINSDFSGAFNNAQASLPVDYMNDADPFEHHVQHEESPLSPHMIGKFAIPNKFWKSVEPYCAPITQEHVTYLENLIKGTEESERLLKIPPKLGKRCQGDRFTDTTDKYLNSIGIPKKRIQDVRKLASPMGPQTQRLLGALTPGASTKRNECSSSSGVADRKHFMASLDVTGAEDVERRLQAELEENGILEPDDENNNADDELLTDWKMTARKLEMVTKTNKEILTYLLKQAEVHLKKHEIFERLDVIDNNAMEALQKIQQSKLKKCVGLSKKEREAGWKLLMERQELVAKLKQLNEELDASYSMPFPKVPGVSSAISLEENGPSDAGNHPEARGSDAVEGSS